MAVFAIQMTFRRRLLLSSVLGICLSLLILGGVLLGVDVVSQKSTLIQRAATTAHLLALNSRIGLMAQDDAALNDLLSALSDDSSLLLAELYRTDWRHSSTPYRVARYLRDASLQSPAKLHFTQMPELHESHLDYFYPIYQDANLIGLLVLRFSFEEQRSRQTQGLFIVIGVALLSVLLASLIAGLLQRSFTQPISELVATANQVSRTQDFSARARQFSNDELGELTRVFNDMLATVQKHNRERERAEQETRALNLSLEDTISRRTGELTRTNQELQHTLSSLKQTQSQLVESEKMASLGSLVAGVAHEINTPVGIGVTAASHLSETVHRFEEKYKSNQLTRSDFEKLIGTASESCHIILNNLRRAADLIRSFKKVAVDQSSEEIQQFNLHHYLDDVLLSLRPKIKRSPHQVEMDCPQDLMVRTYPGALAQIITNLVNNALMHAFEDDRPGTMRIKLERLADQRIQLSFSDDGKGIAAEHMPKIFDPFFTTKRGQGGSGLGLHILYNMVTQRLGGEIQCQSNPGQGTRFCIRFASIR